MIDENGERLRGPAMIESVFATMFKDRPGATFTVFPASLRFISPDVAQEEGRNLVKLKGDEGPSTRHYTLTYVKQGNRWRYSQRPGGAGDGDQPSSAARGAGLARGRMDRRESGLPGAYDLPLDRGRQFPAPRFHRPGPGQVGDDRERADRMGPLQATDRVVGVRLRRGARDGAWSRDANAWVIKSCGVLPDGRSATATHILTRVSPQSARWASIERTVGDRVVHDHAEYLMVRQPPKPQAP